MVNAPHWKKWTIGKLISQTKTTIQTGPFGTVLRASEFVDYGIPVISVREIREGFIRVTDETPCVTDETFSQLGKYALSAKDIVFARKGSVERSAVIPVDMERCFLGSDGIRIRFDENVVCPDLMLYIFQNPSTKQFLIQSSYGTTMAGLNEKILSALEFYLPEDIEEQKRIAQVLTDIDKQLVLTGEMIAKKKAIKQGAMQELLTGKKRLPGFSGEWQNFNLMMRSKIKARIGWQGLKKSEYLDSGYALLVTGTDFNNGRVQWNSCHYVTRSRYSQDCNIQIRNDDILITKDGSLGKTALVQGLTKPATLNSGIFVIRPVQNAYDPVFAYYILSSFVFKDFLDKLSAGSTIIHLYQKDISKFEFPLPPTIEEQKAIAVVLSEIDADIAALEEELVKYRQIKQGMMQQLLTGKIRLV